MGKASGRKAGTDNARSIKIHDASSVVNAFQVVSRMLGQRSLEPAAHVLGMLEQWEQSPVMLRVDRDFALALADTSADIKVTGGWLDRMPHNAIAFSFPDPIVLVRDGHTYRYTGMLASGLTLTGNSTTYEPIPAAAGICCLWTYTVDDILIPGTVPVAFLSRGEIIAGESLEDYIEESVRRQDFGDDPASSAFLTTVSLQLMLYLASAEPDVNWPAPVSIARPHHMKDARIGHLGWRVGTAFRQIEGALSRAGSLDGGWRMPPHVRRAHYQRVRVANRDAAGRITGTQHGDEGVDWVYETRWIPPTPVNASHGVDPVIRELIP